MAERSEAKSMKRSLASKYLKFLFLTRIFANKASSYLIYSYGFFFFRENDDSEVLSCEFDILNASNRFNVGAAVV